MPSTCGPHIIGSSLGGLIVAALFTAYIVNAKKAIKAKKPIKLPNMTTQVFVYIFLAGAAINILRGMFGTNPPYTYNLNV